MKGTRMMLVVCLSMLAMLCIVLPAGAAQDGIPAAKFTVRSYIYEQNGEVHSMDAAPFVENGRVYVPVNFLADSIHVNVKWDPFTQSVYLDREFSYNQMMAERFMILYIGQTYYDWGTIKGSNKVENHETIDVPPVIRDGRTYLPARYVADNYGLLVEWNEQTQSVELWNEFTGTPITYHSQKNGFSITFPESWQNKYVVKDSENYVVIYQKSQYDATNGEGGRIFSVLVYTPEKWKAEGKGISDMTDDFGSISSKQAVYYFAGPTDVQFDYQDKQATKEYSEMQNDIPAIEKTFSIDRNE
ncbi:MAG TPA: copper amine oxidase N-terminal domain-containing protein [Syntrophomonadaceae bacterium]|nr:copper amine oxidase N-terminal domain-containing protein [Syntrophomonadaceae bacterium]